MHRKTGVAINFLRYNDPQQTLLNLLGSVVQQLVQERPVIALTQNIYTQHNAGETPALQEELMALMRTALKEFDIVYLVVDGLDEADEDTRWELVQELMQLPDNVHLLCTSRSPEALDEDAQTFKRFEVRAHAEDLELYIDDQIQKNKHLRAMIRRRPPLRRDIKYDVVKVAKDM